MTKMTLSAIRWSVRAGISLVSKLRLYTL